MEAVVYGSGGILNVCWCWSLELEVVSIVSCTIDSTTGSPKFWVGSLFLPADVPGGQRKSISQKSKKAKKDSACGQCLIHSVIVHTNDVVQNVLRFQERKVFLIEY